MKKFLCICLFFGAPFAMAIEEPAFKVISKTGKFEIRQYAPYLIAQTWVEGDMDDAGSQGFRRIADFIFGNNQLPGGQASGKIAMTAPVTMEPQSAKIAMTAPVAMEPSDNTSGMKSAQRWRVQFAMPRQYTLANIPQPKNAAVTLSEVPEKYVAVHSYSGLNTLQRVQDKTDELLQWAKTSSLVTKGPPQLARYDPPWTLPMWRRNEIMVEIEAP
jgi:hypothetical protein